MEPIPPFEVSEIDESVPAKRRYTAVAGICFSVLLLTYVWLGSTPKSFTLPYTFTVEPGMSVAAIADKAKDEHLVRSSLFLYILLTLRHDPTNIYAGNYSFTDPLSVYGVARQLGSGNIDDESIRLTIPEGLRISEVADLVHTVLPHISTEDYQTAAAGSEGYLYPETYYIPEQFTASDIVALQKQTYAERIEPIAATIAASGHTEAEIITLASIIEREANDETSMKMVSGIFQNRLDIGMALQADATLAYALDTDINELQAGELAEHLREFDSPYNTYRYAGLPPTPIGNPGLTAVEAALTPTPSEYFYYITGSDGSFYYAKTLEEHNANIAHHLQ